MQQSRNYQFQSRPQAVASGRRKYREQPDPNFKATRKNLMHDRRIVRGNTHAAIIEHPAQAFAQRDVERVHTRGNPRRTRRFSNRDMQRQMQEEMYQPEPEEDMLEELPMDREASLAAALINVHVEPIKFIPKTQGVNAATETSEQELFDFDLAVEPVLEVLVGKSLDQSLNAVLSFKERIHAKLKRQDYQVERQLNLATSKRLEAECLRRTEEKKNRAAQDREMKIREKVVAHKVSSRKTAAEFVVSLQKSVMEETEKQGHYHNEVIHQVETVFVPWLLVQVSSRLNETKAARDEVDALIQSSINRVLAEVDAEDARLQAIEDQKLKEIEERKALVAHIEGLKAERAAKAAEIARQKAEAEALAQRLAEEAERAAELEEEAAQRAAENGDSMAADSTTGGSLLDASASIAEGNEDEES